VLQKCSMPGMPKSRIDELIAVSDAHTDGLLVGRACFEAALAEGRTLADLTADIVTMLDSAPPEVMQQLRRDSDIDVASLPRAVRTALGRRQRAATLMDAVREAASVLYPDGVPSAAVLPNGQLCSEVRAYLIEHEMVRLSASGEAIIHDDTILIALGRKKPRRR
jgi:hypothetical protein